MIKFKLKDNFKNRFEKFLSSDLFYNQPKYSKTSYWEYHSKQINYSIKNSLLTLKGKSGYYIPDKKNSYNFFLRSLKTVIKKLIGLERSPKLSYKAAFAKIMNSDKNVGFQQFSNAVEESFQKRLPFLRNHLQVCSSLYRPL